MQFYCHKGSKRKALICEIPEVEYLSSLIYLLPSILDNIGTIFHLTPPDIIHHEKYRYVFFFKSQNFIDLFRNIIKPLNFIAFLDAKLVNKQNDF